MPRGFNDLEVPGRQKAEELTEPVERAKANR